MYLCLFACLVIFLGGCKKIDSPGNLVPITADKDFRIPSIKINDRILNSEAFGHPDSALVINIHGGPGADYRYMLQVKDLAGAGYRVVFYDQVGSGLSQRFDEDYYKDKNLDEIFLNELKGVINYYKKGKNQKVILFGHSWGAIMATAYAAKNSNDIYGMVLIEPGGLKWDDIVEYISESQSTPLWAEMSSDALYQDQFISSKKNNHEILDYKIGMLGSHGSPNTEFEDENGAFNNMFWRYGAVMNLINFNYGQKHKPNFSEGIKKYNRPILFIHGGKGNI